MHFLDLPLEIRESIYYHYYESHILHPCSAPPDAHRFTYPPCSRTRACVQHYPFYDEMLYLTVYVHHPAPLSCCSCPSCEGHANSVENKGTVSYSASNLTSTTKSSTIPNIHKVPASTLLSLNLTCHQINSETLKLHPKPTPILNFDIYALHELSYPSKSHILPFPPVCNSRPDPNTPLCTTRTVNGVSSIVMYNNPNSANERLLYRLRHLDVNVAYYTYDLATSMATSNTDGIALLSMAWSEFDVADMDYRSIFQNVVIMKLDRACAVLLGEGRVSSAITADNRAARREQQQQQQQGPPNNYTNNNNNNNYNNNNTSDNDNQIDNELDNIDYYDDDPNDVVILNQNYDSEDEKDTTIFPSLQRIRLIFGERIRHVKLYNEGGGGGGEGNGGQRWDGLADGWRARVIELKDAVDERNARRSRRSTSSRRSTDSNGSSSSSNNGSKKEKGWDLEVEFMGVMKKGRMTLENVRDNQELDEP